MTFTQNYLHALLTHLSNKDIIYDPDLPWVLRKNEDKLVIEEPTEFYESGKYRHQKELLERHLERLLAHNVSWEGGDPISPVDLRLTRQFTEDFSHGERFYCNFQNKPKKDRNKITIDGKPVGSLDISQCHPMLILRIFKAREKEDGLFSQFNEDVYQVHGYDHLPRECRKKVVNTLLNAKTLDTGISSILNTRWWLDGFTNEIKTVTFKKKKRYGDKIFENKKEALDFVDNFKLQHPLYSEMLGSGVGLKLQGFDGNITYNMLKLADMLGIPIIPIHEEFLCKAEDNEKIIELLRGAVSVVLHNYMQSGNIKAKWSDRDGNKEEISIAL